MSTPAQVRANLQLSRAREPDSARSSYTRHPRIQRRGGSERVYGVATDNYFGSGAASPGTGANVDNGTLGTADGWIGAKSAGELLT